MTTEILNEAPTIVLKDVLTIHLTATLNREDGSITLDYTDGADYAKYDVIDIAPSADVTIQIKASDGATLLRGAYGISSTQLPSNTPFSTNDKVVISNVFKASSSSGGQSSWGFTVTTNEGSSKSKDPTLILKTKTDTDRGPGHGRHVPAPAHRGRPRAAG